MHKAVKRQIKKIEEDRKAEAERRSKYWDCQSDDEYCSFKDWWNDNIRMVISVAIIVVIALALYAYSNDAERRYLSCQETGTYMGTTNECKGIPKK